MIQLAVSKGLNLKCTKFPHKDIKKQTWYLAFGRTANQIDLTLFSNRFIIAITDIRLLKRKNGSDHNL
jgi:hypothetical protein